MINLLLSLIISSSFACKEPVYFLQKNEKAPCTGYLFSPEMELKIREDIVAYDGLKLEHQLLQKELDLTKELNLELVREIKAKDAILQVKKYENILYFALGIVVAGSIAYVAR